VTLVDEIVEQAQQAGTTEPSQVLGIAEAVIDSYRDGQSPEDRSVVRVSDRWLALVLYGLAMELL